MENSSNIQKNISKKEFEKLEEILAKSSSVLESRGPEVIKSISEIAKDNFDMLDRSFSVANLLHQFELKSIDLWLDIIKYLSPLFATSIIAGFTVDLVSIKSDILAWIGGTGFVVSIVSLFAVLIPRRNKILNRQKEEYSKLINAFKDWQKVVDINKKMASIKDLSDEKIDKIMQDILDIRKKQNEHTKS